MCMVTTRGSLGVGTRHAAYVKRYDELKAEYMLLGIPAGRAAAMAVETMRDESRDAGVRPDAESAETRD